MSIGIQKAPIWKRISAFLFDAMLVISLGLVFLIGMSSFMNFDAHTSTMSTYLTAYETKYQIPEYSEEEFNALTEDEKFAYNALQEEMLTEYFQDPVVSSTITKLTTLILVAVGVSLLLAYIIVFFLIALPFKNGQTLGKKAFALAVMRTSGVKVSKPVLLTRTVVGLFVIETMFPLMLIALTIVRFLGGIGIITPILLFVLELGVMIYTPTNSSIHDLMCDTVVVDMASQEIFETEEELLAYKKRLAAQKAAEAEGERVHFTDLKQTTKKVEKAEAVNAESKESAASPAKATPTDTKDENNQEID